MESAGNGNCIHHEIHHEVHREIHHENGHDEGVGMSTSDHDDAGDRISGDEPRAGSEALADRRSPKQPDPQGSNAQGWDPHDGSDVSSDRAERETTHEADDDETDDDETDDDKADDDTGVDRYRDSPGAAIDDTSGDVPEPNEPG